MKVAIIPARGGSKRIPRKNIRIFNGMPMIYWSISKAQATGLFDRIVVSTDDDEIKELAESFGAVAPFRRDSSLADDNSPTAPVVADAVKRCQNLGWPITHACCIYPCTPFLNSGDLVKAFERLSQENLKFCYPVTKYHHPIHRALSIDKNYRAKFLFEEFELTRTQDLGTFYHDTGQFYWGTSSAWIGGGRMHSDGGVILVPSWRVIDIDDLEDWRRAELLFSRIEGAGRD